MAVRQNISKTELTVFLIYFILNELGGTGRGTNGVLYLSSTPRSCRVQDLGTCRKDDLSVIYVLVALAARTLLVPSSLRPLARAPTHRKKTFNLISPCSKVEIVKMDRD